MDVRPEPKALKIAGNLLSLQLKLLSTLSFENGAHQMVSSDDLGHSGCGPSIEGALQFGSDMGYGGPQWS